MGLCGLSGRLTSRHQVVSEDRQAEVPRQRCQGGPDPRELLGEARGLCAKVAEGPKTKDAMGMVAQYVVPAGEQVVGFNQLGGRNSQSVRAEGRAEKQQLET